MKHRTSAILIAVLVLLSTVTANAQSPNMLADLAARINGERTAHGMVPYALDGDLTTAAQAHASDIARTGKLSHVGSDGSTVFQRVARTGYGSYSWGRRLGENWAWYHSTATAMQKWMDSRPHRENILHALYREFGIGVAANPVGGYVFVIVFGAQPNVLPVFVNDGAGSTPGVGVTLALSDEQVAPSGDTPTTIGHPTQIQLSNDPSFPGADWEPYSARKSWTLTSGSGTKTVYVKFRDARGRSVTSSDSIVLGGAAAAVNNTGASPTAKPKASPTQTRRPTASPSLPPGPTASRTRTPRPTARPSPTTARTPVPTATELPIPLDSAVAEASTAETPTPGPTSGPTTFLEQPTEIAAVVLSEPDGTNESTVGRVAHVGSLSENAASSAFAIGALGRTSGVALGVFTVGMVLGIMALMRFRFRSRYSPIQYSIEKRKDRNGTRCK